MGAIIAITGKAGAGKTTILSNLSCAYANADTTVGVFCCDLRYSSLPQAFAGLDEIPAEKSLGLILGKASLKDTFTEYKHVPNLFISAPAPKEACFSYEPPDGEGIKRFLTLLRATYDYTFIEAGEVMFNQLSALAIQESDATINIVDATFQGVAWEQSCYEMLLMLRGGKSIINVLNDPCGVGAIKDIDRFLGHKIDIRLRHSAAIANSVKKGLPVVIDANAGFGARRVEKRIAALCAQIGGTL